MQTYEHVWTTKENWLSSVTVTFFKWVLPKRRQFIHFFIYCIFLVQDLANLMFVYCLFHFSISFFLSTTICLNPHSRVMSSCDIEGSSRDPPDVAFRALLMSQPLFSSTGHKPLSPCVLKLQHQYPHSLTAQCLVKPKGLFLKLQVSPGFTNRNQFYSYSSIWGNHVSKCKAYQLGKCVFCHRIQYFVINLLRSTCCWLLELLHWETPLKWCQCPDVISRGFSGVSARTTLSGFLQLWHKIVVKCNMTIIIVDYWWRKRLFFLFDVLVKLICRCHFHRECCHCLSQWNVVVNKRKNKILQ